MKKEFFLFWVVFLILVGFWFIGISASFGLDGYIHVLTIATVIVGIIGFMLSKKFTER